MLAHNHLHFLITEPPPPNNNQPWENYTHAPVLYPLTSSLIHSWWYPTQRGVSRLPWLSGHKLVPTWRVALPRQRPHNSLARSYRPRHAPHFSFKPIRGFSRVHGPVTHLAGPGGGERFRFPGSELLPPGLSAPSQEVLLRSVALGGGQVDRWGGEG